MNSFHQYMNTFRVLMKYGSKIFSGMCVVMCMYKILTTLGGILYPVNKVGRVNENLGRDFQKPSSYFSFKLKRFLRSLLITCVELVALRKKVSGQHL